MTADNDVDRFLRTFTVLLLILELASAANNASTAASDKLTTRAKAKATKHYGGGGGGDDDDDGQYHGGNGLDDEQGSNYIPFQWKVEIIKREYDDYVLPDGTVYRVPMGAIPPHRYTGSEPYEVPYYVLKDDKYRREHEEAGGLAYGEAPKLVESFDGQTLEQLWQDWYDNAYWDRGPGPYLGPRHYLQDYDNNNIKSYNSNEYSDDDDGGYSAPSEKQHVTLYGLANAKRPMRKSSSSSLGSTSPKQRPMTLSYKLSPSRRRNNVTSASLKHWLNSWSSTTTTTTTRPPRPSPSKQPPRGDHQSAFSKSVDVQVGRRHNQNSNNGRATSSKPAAVVSPTSANDIGSWAQLLRHTADPVWFRQMQMQSDRRVRRQHPFLTTFRNTLAARNRSY